MFPRARETEDASDKHSSWWERRAPSAAYARRGLRVARATAWRRFGCSGQRLHEGHGSGSSSRGSAPPGLAPLVARRGPSTQPIARTGARQKNMSVV
jgi:hypothetical protein